MFMARISPDGSTADGLEEWRKLFRGADICDVIDHAVRVALADSPQEFIRRRDHIAERLFTVATAAPPPTSPGKAVAAASSSEKSKVSSCTGETEADGGGMNNLGHGSDCDDDAPFDPDFLQMLADEIDEDVQEVNEVLRVKEILLYHEEQSVGLLFESLRRLQLMQVSTERLKGTQVGGAVSTLREHKAPEIRNLARTLVRGWGAVVDEWVSFTDAIVARNSDTCSDLSNPSAVKDEGRLLTPPMDAGAFYVTHCTSIQQVFELFDGMDEDGNLKTSIDNNSGSGNNSLNNGVKPSNPGTVSNQQNAQAMTNAGDKTLSTRRDLPLRQERQAKPQKLTHYDGNTLLMSHGIPTEQRHQLRQTNPHKLPNADENTVLTRQGLPARRDQPPLRPRNLQNSLFGAAHEPGGLFKETPKTKKPCVEMKPKPTQDPMVAARKPPVAAARNLLSGHINNPLMPAQAWARPKVGMRKRKCQLADMGLEKTRRKLQEAYQEAENAKRQRSVQVVDMHDIPKRKQRKAPSMKPRIDIRTRVWAKSWRK